MLKKKKNGEGRRATKRKGTGKGARMPKSKSLDRDQGGEKKI